MTTLIEIVISLFIISSMILGLDAMQVGALKQADAAYYASIAIDQLEIVANQLASNPGEQILKQQAKLQENIKAALPNGVGNITSKSGGYDIAIKWGLPSAKDCETDQIRSNCLRLSINEEGGWHHFA